MIVENIKTKVGFSGFLTKYWLLLFTVVVGVTFGLMRPEFFKIANLLNILSSACLAGIAGIGLTCVMATGEIDFSGGAEITGGATFMALLIQRGIIKNYFLAIAATIAIMILIGLFNGFLNIKVGIPSFIATMGTSFALKGFFKWATNSQTIKGVSMKCPIFTFAGQGDLFDIFPMPLVIIAVIATVAIIFTERTKQGKYLYAVGVNPRACKMVGIDAQKCKFIGFIISAVLCGICGIVQGSMANGSSNTVGDSMMLQAITVLMLGATFVKVGTFNVAGTLVGAVLLSELLTGLTMIGASAIVRNLVDGAVLLIGVSIVSLIKKRSNKSVG